MLDSFGELCYNIKVIVEILTKRRNHMSNALSLLIDCVWLIAGFFLLIYGANFFVDGSSAVAKRLKVPSLIIGLTIVAMGTSAPECAVSISAALAGSNELAIANVVGSNIMNLMMICGICALVCPMPVKKSSLLQEYPISVGAAVLLLVLGLMGMSVGRIEGIILLLVFAAFLTWTVLTALKSRQESEEEYKILPIWKCILFIVGGMAAIVFGADRVVDSASSIAGAFGLSENLIGLTIVAFGTSLPELVTSVVAAKKNEVEMALGNVIGSNIFNILMVLGISTAISPLAFIGENIVDIVALIAMSVLVWLMAWPKKKLGRVHGLIMVLVYAGYMVYACMR